MSRTQPQLNLNESIFSAADYRARTDGARQLPWFCPLFFSGLSDDIENKLESNISIVSWSW